MAVIGPGPDFRLRAAAVVYYLTAADTKKIPDPTTWIQVRKLYSRVYTRWMVHLGGLLSMLSHR